MAWGLLQEMTPEELRGRVFSVLNTGAMSASMLGMVGFGWTAHRLGPVMSLMGMTAVFAMTAGVTLLLCVLRRVDIAAFLRVLHQVT